MFRRSGEVAIGVATVPPPHRGTSFVCLFTGIVAQPRGWLPSILSLSNTFIIWTLMSRCCRFFIIALCSLWYHFIFRHYGVMNEWRDPLLQVTCSRRVTKAVISGRASWCYYVFLCECIGDVDCYIFLLDCLRRLNSSYFILLYRLCEFAYSLAYCRR